jgi:hypothetical protein
MATDASNNSLDALRDIMKRTVRDALERYGKVAVKYHPREKEDYLGRYDGCEVLPKQTPMELIYLKLRGKGVEEVTGPLSTSLYTAKIILGDEVKVTVISTVDPEAKQFITRLGLEVQGQGI